MIMLLVALDPINWLDLDMLVFLQSRQAASDPSV